MKISDRMYELLRILMLVSFLPVLFCVGVIGNHMDYNDSMKITTRLPGQALFLIALVGLFVWILLFRKCRRLKIDGKINWAADFVLIVLFTALYFVNVWIAKEICFYLPWDIMIVRGLAYKIANRESIGYEYYLSMYYNNIPISYILGRLYRKATEIKDYAYPFAYDFIWIQVNCVLISVTGFLSCLVVKKLTKTLMPVMTMFFLFLLLCGISAWKIAPYTDTYGLVFPIACIYLYISYRQAEHIWSRCLWLILAVAVGMAGGFVKPNVYILILALLIVEFIELLRHFKKQWMFFLTELILVLALLKGNSIFQENIIQEIGLDYNQEIEAGWQHYFYMGLNEETTGGYCAEDAAIFGEFQTSKKDRNQAELERAGERLRARGFAGSIYFYLRKLVMTFNDGLFGWSKEGWKYEDYPENMASNTKVTRTLRNIFCPDDWDNDAGGYDVLCQLVWYFALLGIPGICLIPKGKIEKFGILMVSFMGVFFYQMLFEARARYLFVFLPVILSVSVCGFCEYADRAAAFWEQRKRSLPVITRKKALGSEGTERWEQ